VEIKGGVYILRWGAVIESPALRKQRRVGNNDIKNGARQAQGEASTSRTSREAARVKGPGENARRRKQSEIQGVPSTLLHPLLQGKCEIRTTGETCHEDETSGDCHYCADSCELAAPPVRAEERGELGGR
jgi:hypothetical protein